MATNIIPLNVYEIDGQPVKTPATQGFPSMSQLLPYFGSDQRLYGIIIGATDGRHYGVVQTVSQMIALANA